jgi:hypothetical protein
MTTDMDVFFKHEVCRGPVVLVDMTLGPLGHTAITGINTTLKHTSGDVCRSGTSTSVFMLRLELINDAIDFYKSTGAGFRCDPNILAECTVAMESLYRRFPHDTFNDSETQLRRLELLNEAIDFYKSTGTGFRCDPNILAECTVDMESLYRRFTHDTFNDSETQLRRFVATKNTPMSLLMCSRLATTSNNVVWTQLATKPTSLRANLLPDIPTYKFGIRCMGGLKFSGQSWSDDKGVCHITSGPVKACVLVQSSSVVRNDAVTLN